MSNTNILVSNLKKAEISNYSLAVFFLYSLAYFWYGEPMIMSVFPVTLAFSFIASKLGNLAIPWLKVNPRYLVIGATAITMCLTYETATHAAILENVEEAMTEVLTAAGDGVNEEAITGFFAFIRVVIVIAFVISIIAGIYKAVSGEDVKPIAVALAIAIFAVIAIEIMAGLIVSV